jgi:hypothetical protein
MILVGFEWVTLIQSFMYEALASRQRRSECMLCMQPDWPERERERYLNSETTSPLYVSISQTRLA